MIDAALQRSLSGFSDGLAVVLFALCGVAPPSPRPPCRPPARRSTPSAGTPAKRIGRAHKVHQVKGLRP